MRVPSKPRRTVTSGHEVQEWCLATQHRLARLGKPRQHVARPRPLFSVYVGCSNGFFLESLRRNMSNLELWRNMERGLDVFFSVFGSAIIWSLALGTLALRGIICRYGEDDCLWPSAQWTLPELVTCASRVAVPTPSCVFLGSLVMSPCFTSPNH